MSSNNDDGTCGNDGGLQEQLEKLIRGHLIELQRLDERQRMWELLVEIWDPSKSESFEVAALAFRRMARIHEMIEAAREKQELYPWVFTPAAAVAFEGIYEQSVVFWLMVPPSRDVDELPPAVEALIALQVGGFTAAVSGRSSG